MQIAEFVQQFQHGGSNAAFFNLVFMNVFFFKDSALS